MRCITLLVITAVLLSGCSRISLSDLGTGIGATAGATLGALTGNPAVVAVTASGGAAVGAVLVEDAVSPDKFCQHNPDQCNEYLFWSSVKDAIHWIIGAVVALIALAWLIPGPQSLFRRKKR